MPTTMIIVSHRGLCSINQTGMTSLNTSIDELPVEVRFEQALEAQELQCTAPKSFSRCHVSIRSARAFPAEVLPPTPLAFSEVNRAAPSVLLPDVVFEVRCCARVHSRRREVKRAGGGAVGVGVAQAVPAGHREQHGSFASVCACCRQSRARCVPSVSPLHCHFSATRHDTQYSHCGEGTRPQSGTLWLFSLLVRARVEESPCQGIAAHSAKTETPAYVPMENL
ncbi:unnamed protein product [Pleuronectes platessa]|uniref:Uncharacterized protein n=1 Tax=Pleuronectes platessa TaxID=8262 RepID=A0A9N7UP32_PLEPL|nr:unnamed protein product [Pleuronectes platessa]